MHTSAAAAASAPARSAAEEPRGLVQAAGAAVGALGAIDVLIGIAMLGSASSYDAAAGGEAAVSAMRAYGLRSLFVGAASLAFVWVTLGEPGARAAWFLVPLALVAVDIAGDVSAFIGGAIAWRVVAVTAAVHEMLAAAITAVAVALWRRERAFRRPTRPSK